MTTVWRPRRGVVVEVDAANAGAPLGAPALAAFETLDLVYRALCALLFNYVPTSGHPGGSISSGRFTAALVFDAMDYDLGDPERDDADLLSYAAGHKAMGLYAMWALRDEIARLAAPELLPADEARRLRLEDLLGFRRNPITKTPLFRRLRARALDGHPTPATPFVRLATGASGVGMAGSIGLAIGARDRFGAACPRIHISEGEGGLTPGRVAEALAAAGTARLSNAMVHLDWNQASIDSERVCREGDAPGDYVQWQPAELFHLHDWNVVSVADGHDLSQVVAAQRLAAGLDTGQPTAIVYRTLKGWHYGIEGRASHGAGHRLCSAGFYRSVAELTQGTDDTAIAGDAFPTCASDDPRCAGRDGAEVREECFWAALQLVRRRLEHETEAAALLAGRLVAARRRLDGRGLRPRPDAPRPGAVFAMASDVAGSAPAGLHPWPGSKATLRETLGNALGALNRESRGALLVASADLLGSTSVNLAAAGFATGFWNAADNPGARELATGGICEDAMSGILSGVSAFGSAIGVGSSYGAFMAPLGHVAARLHAIGQQARRAATGEPYRPLVLVCAHAGLATGEDGPTHADPQALQLLQEDFPAGTAVTLTPWEPQEVWPLLCAALASRPALVFPFVTRPAEPVLDRDALGLGSAAAAAQGVELLRAPRGPADVTVVLQESAVTYAFVTGALPLLDDDGIDARVYVVTSAELFDAQAPERRERLFPAAHGAEALGITGFTLPTLYRWISSPEGIAASLHPYRHGHYLGSGQGDVVLTEAGLDGESQYRAVREWLDARAAARTGLTRS